MDFAGINQYYPQKEENPISLLTHLATIEDPRRDINKKHDLLDLLFLTVSAVLSGAEGWKGIQEFGDDKSSGETICTSEGRPQGCVQGRAQ